ncbi:hypothetical protein [Pedobacter panaciterrae]
MLISSFGFSNNKTSSNFNDDYITEVTFPAGYLVGDYIEFVKAAPFDAGSSGYYELSISYTRGNVASAATHIASISHANPALWRELGRINSNGYASGGSDGHNFTIDCNTQSINPRFRIRAIRTLGVTTSPLTVHIKIRSINQTNTWTAINVTGNDLTVNKFLPMTNDWSLYVGDPYLTTGANIAIKAIQNGNVGIGTTTPNAKLAVNGRIRAQEIKVEIADWPDYVFAEDYQLPSLQQTEKHIKEKGHLPGIPSAEEVKANGVDLGEMNAKLLKKMEEMTLIMIQLNKKVEQQAETLKIQQKQIDKLK